MAFSGKACPVWFQSTRPRGARRISRGNTSLSGCFNPRAREGRDASDRHLTPKEKRFNPRAREGRDPSGSKPPVGMGCFNPRAREGRDASQVISEVGHQRFNPRAREGRDAIHKAVWRGIKVSIHAPARGATLYREG